MLVGAATAAIGSASPWCKRQSSPDTPSIFFLTHSTLSNLTRSSHSSHFTSPNHTDFFPLCIEQNQPNPLRQDSPVPSLPCKQTPRQPTPGPSGTRWLEDLFCGKEPKFHLISTFGSSELTLPPFVEPSQTNEPPIPCPSPSSKPHEDILTCDPEPEVALTQSMEEPFVPPRTPPPPPLIPTMRLSRNSLTYDRPQ
ncbi:hypothetical protein O181_062982 [Austropuccinia psidii MF-1]|uniref:Uncharacterized protein n=1 Tax=Austropuccinia psidii MF-1 TaxID=1389203 RepID=A0A9Q3ENN4_9BASI|nr:hypothetical protein [Austropuccinia psidii MF-1]